MKRFSYWWFAFFVLTIFGLSLPLSDANGTLTLTGKVRPSLKLSSKSVTLHGCINGTTTSNSITPFIFNDRIDFGDIADSNNSPSADYTLKTSANCSYKVVASCKEFSQYNLSYQSKPVTKCDFIQISSPGVHSLSLSLLSTGTVSAQSTVIARGSATTQEGEELPLSFTVQPGLTPADGKSTGTFSTVVEFGIYPSD